MKPEKSPTTSVASADESHDEKIRPLGSAVAVAAGAATGAAVGGAVGGPVGTLVGQAAYASEEDALESARDREWDQIYPSHTRPGTLRVPLQELHDERSGRLDTAKVAEYLDRSLKQMADAMGKRYSAVHKTPAAPDVQPFLQSIKTSLVILEDVLGNRSVVLAWLNSPHPDLGHKTPIDVILQGHPNAVKNMLQAAIIGTPS